MDYSSIGYKRAMSKARWVGELDELDNKTRLILSEGTVFGEKYFTVLPRFVSNGSINGQTWIDIELWCTEQFGPTPNDGVWTPGARWYMNNSKFWFRNEADLSWLILRWS